MKYFTLCLLLQLFILTPVSALEPLTKAELVYIQTCHDNVNLEKKLLSPKKAEECRDRLKPSEDLFKKLTEVSPDVATDIIAYSNILMDFGRIVSETPPDMLPKALRLSIESDPCPLCELGMGPLPERYFDWVKRYYPDRLSMIKKISRTWDSLGDIRHKGLLATGVNATSWNQKPFSARYEALNDWAKDATYKLNGMPDSEPKFAAVRANGPILMEDLFDAWYRPVLIKMMSMANTKQPVAKPGNLIRDSKGKAIIKKNEKLDKIGSQSTADQTVALSQIFDNASVAGEMAALAVTGKAQAGNSLTSEQFAALPERLIRKGEDGAMSGPLAEELKGTKVGDEVLEFYKNKTYTQASTNKFVLDFQKQRPTVFGGWDQTTKTIDLNTEVVNNWMRSRIPPVTPEQLMSGDPDKNPAVKALAESLASTFVHEPTHQEYGAWAKEKGVEINQVYDGQALENRAPYTRAEEVGAFSREGLFLLEKSRSKDPGYLSRLSGVERDTYATFVKEGSDGLKLSVNRNSAYSGVPTFEATAAAKFSGQAVTDARRIAQLEAARKKNPDTFDLSDQMELRNLRENSDKTIKWYAAEMERAAETERKYNAWRLELLKKKSSAKKLASSVPGL